MNGPSAACRVGRGSIRRSRRPAKPCARCPTSRAPPTQLITAATASIGKQRSGCGIAGARGGPSYLARASKSIRSTRSATHRRRPEAPRRRDRQARRGAWPKSRARAVRGCGRWAEPAMTAAQVDLALVEAPAAWTTSARRRSSRRSRLRSMTYELDVARGVVSRGAPVTSIRRASYEGARRRDPQRSEAAYDLGVLYKEYIAPHGGATPRTRPRRAAFREAAALTPASDAAQLAVLCDKARALVTPPPATK